MIELTVGDFLCEGGEVPPEAKRFAGVYVVGDVATIFYVGRSVDCIQRLVEHNRWNWSPLGQLIEDNEPASFEWVTRLFTSEEFECETLEAAELEAIRKLRPCLNRRGHATKPPPLPERYRGKERERSEVLREKMQRVDE